MCQWVTCDCVCFAPPSRHSTFRRHTSRVSCTTSGFLSLQNPPNYYLSTNNQITFCSYYLQLFATLREQLEEVFIEAVVISAAYNRTCVRPPVDLVIDVCGCSVTPKPFIRNIGFVFGDTMSMTAQIRSVCQVAYCHICVIATIRKCLSTAACKTTIHALE